MCSMSPIAPITVTSSPREGWARAPAASMRSITVWISSSVAAAFITIIISLGSSNSRRWTLYETTGARLTGRGRWFTAERLEKSPGGVRVATTRGTGEAGGIGTGRVRGAVKHGRDRVQSNRHRPAGPDGLEQGAERLEEALVLRLGADRHAQRARAAER